MTDKDYSKLPYMSNSDLPTCKYGKASALAAPIRDAVNSARDRQPHTMAEVRAVLLCALVWIDQEPKDAKPKKAPKREIVDDGVCDPLDVLLGPAET